MLFWLFWCSLWLGLGWWWCFVWFGCICCCGFSVCFAAWTSVGFDVVCFLVGYLLVCCFCLSWLCLCFSCLLFVCFVCVYVWFGFSVFCLFVILLDYELIWFDCFSFCVLGVFPLLCVWMILCLDNSVAVDLYDLFE